MFIEGIMYIYFDISSLQQSDRCSFIVLATVLSPDKADKQDRKCYSFRGVCIIVRRTGNNHMINKRDNNRALKKIQLSDVMEIMHVGASSD